MSQTSVFYKKGDVVTTPFPYEENPSEDKLRPVVLLAQTHSGFICAYITSILKPHRQGIITINKKDFKEGHLDPYIPSYVHSDKVFTVSSQAIQSKKGTLNDEVVDIIIKTLTDLLVKPPMQQPIPKALERPQRKAF